MRPGLLSDVGLATLVLALGCGDAKGPPITILLDGTRELSVELEPKSSFAEYVEVDDLHHELRVTLASFHTDCHEYRLLHDDEIVLTLVFMTPPDQVPQAGDYPYSDLPDVTLPMDARRVLPKVRRPGESAIFQPGGGVQLTKVSIEPHGRIEGTVDLSYPGDADHAATRLAGRFSAWLCRAAPAPKR
jgi:hypothetical protein